VLAGSTLNFVMMATAAFRLTREAPAQPDEQRRGTA
jgi:hypothetical protein